jgi:two-component system cell cycle sensor histidine kinase/response regulator CckA
VIRNPEARVRDSGIRRGRSRRRWPVWAKTAFATAGAHPGPIDILITDVVLTGVSGRSLATLLLKSRPALKLLFISGYTDDTVLRHGVLGTDDAFLQKPFTPDARARRARKVLDARKGGGRA